MKRILVVLLVVVQLFLLTGNALALSETVTIKAGVSAKGGTDEIKNNTAKKPVVEVDVMSTGGRFLYFWVWKKDFKQVTPTYTINSTGLKDNIFYIDQPGYIVQGDEYHAVWKKSSGISVAQSVEYSFIP